MRASTLLLPFHFYLGLFYLCPIFSYPYIWSRVEPIHNCCCMYLSVWWYLRSFVHCTDSFNSGVPTASATSHVVNKRAEYIHSLLPTSLKFRVCHGENNGQSCSQISRMKLSGNSKHRCRLTL